MENKKICVITSSHNPFDTRIFKKECQSLVNVGYLVTLIAPTNITMQVVDGIRVIGFGELSSRLDRVKNIFTISKIALRQKAYVYHVHEPELILLLPLIKLIFPHSKFIYDVHENYADAIMSGEKHWIGGLFKPVLARLIDFIEKAFAKRVDLVTAAAPDIEIKFNGCNSVSIRNFAPMHIINRVFKDKIPRLNENIKREIIYTGSLTRVRGILEIVKALELIDSRLDVTLTVTGKFHNPEFQKIVERQPGFKKVMFLGWLSSFEEMVSRIINADIAMICFHNDPNLDNAVERSNKLFEYMGMGIPVIVSNLPEWANLINKYHCGLVVNPRDPSDIADKINYLLNHPREAFKMGLNGRKTVLEHYNWENEGKKLVEAYKTLLVE